MLNFNLPFFYSETSNEGRIHNFAAVNHGKSGGGAVKEKFRCIDSVDPMTGCPRNTVFWDGHAHSEI